MSIDITTPILVVPLADLENVGLVNSCRIEYPGMQ